MGVIALAKIDKRQPLTPPVLMAHGKGIVRLVREADPEGGVTEHRVVLSGRMIDLLHEQGQIGSLQHQAATKLRDLYERAGVSVGSTPSRDLESPMGAGGEPPLIADEKAWKLYRNALQQLGEWRGILRSVAVEDRHPSEYGTKHRCNGPATLRAALDRLVRHFGLEGKRR